MQDPRVQGRAPRVAVIGTGGTISNAGVADPLDYLSYLETGVVLEVEEALSRFPELHRVADLETVQFGAFRSRNVGPREWLDLRNKVVSALTPDSVAGIVIMHGTGTLEETAFYLHLAVASTKPVVLVGAQRTPSSIGSDAYSNLINAVRVAASDQARGKGVLVVMNETIHSARDVTKGANHRLHTMVSPSLGPLGYVEPDGSVALYREPVRRHTASSQFSSDVAWDEDMLAPRVDVVYGYAGADGTMIDACVAAGAKGIVVTGFAPGVNTVSQDASIDRALADGVRVVQGSRSAGAVLGRQPTLRRGIVPSGDLTPQASRILLQMCLLHGFDPLRTLSAFEEH